MNRKMRQAKDMLRVEVGPLPDEARNELRARLVERGSPHFRWPGVMNEKVWQQVVDLVGAADATRIVIGMCEEPPDEYL